MAAAVTVNWVTASNAATIGDGARVTSGGALTVSAVNESDDSAKAMGAAYSLGDSTNVAAAVALNVANVTNRATVGADGGAVGNGLTIEAVTR